MPLVPDLLQLSTDGASITDLCRDGDLAVCQPDSQWPDRCVICNSPANGYRTPIRLSWHPTELYFLLFIPPLYMVAAIALTRSATVNVPICSQHVRRRRRSLFLSVALALTVVGSCSAGLELVPKQNFTAAVTVCLAGLTLLIAILVWTTLRSRVLEPRRIQERNVWVTCGRDFLASLPTLERPPS